MLAKTLKRFRCRPSDVLKVLTCLVVFGILETTMADDVAPDEPSGQKFSFDLPMKTLGGLQFWSDVYFFYGWRIQKNVLTGHFRLLDGDDHRHASGTYEVCLEALDRIRRTQKLAPMSGKAVVLVHGIIRSAKSMSAMRKPFQDAGYLVFSFGYPSTCIEIPQAAELFNHAIESLEGIDEIHFVVHSMGGLVVRAYLAKHQDARIRRMVMLGVPNLGALMADRVKGLALYRAIFGPAGQQLVTDPDGLIAKLPVPSFEFAVIAGARGTEDGYNPLVPGDDDGTVSVASTRLPGAADFVTVKSLHSFIMNSPEAIDYTVRFIRTGRFRAEEAAQPIPRLVIEEPPKRGDPRKPTDRQE